MRSHRFSPHLLLSTVLALVLLALPATALAAPGDTSAPQENSEAILDLANPSAGTEHVLIPGEPARWNLGVTTRAAQVTDLVAQLDARGELVEIAGAQTTLALFTCPTRWQAGHCPSGAAEVLGPTALTDLNDETLPLAGSGSIPSDLHVQARVLLPQDVTARVQGHSTTIRLTVTASGATEGGAPGEGDEPGSPSEGDQPSEGGALVPTGARVLLFVALAALAIAAGAGIASAARPRGGR